MKIISEKNCKHPRHRLYTWWANDPLVKINNKHPWTKEGKCLCVACCDCGKILMGGFEDEEDK